MQIEIYAPTQGQPLPPIEWNYPELKKWVEDGLAAYKGRVYTDDNIAMAKQDRANLNKLADAIDTKRKEMKAVYLEPYTEFEAQAKELTALVKAQADEIAAQIKAYDDFRKAETVHHLHCHFSAALDTEGNNAAAALREILLCKRILCITGEAGIADPCDLFVLRKIFRNRECIFAMRFHTERKRFESEIQKICRNRLHCNAKVTDKLNAHLRVVSVSVAELLGVGNAVIGFVGCGKLGILVTLRPIKPTAVNNASADDLCVTVHVLCCRVNNDIRTEFKRTAEYRCRESIIHDQRNTIGMGNFSIFFKIISRI